MIDIVTLVFYQFAAILLVAATLVVVSKKPVKSVLSLILAFFASSVLWMLQQAEFLSLALIFVYIGAVMTLFLFIVLMINANKIPARNRVWAFLPFLLAIASIFVYAFYRAFTPSNFSGLESFSSYEGSTMLGSAENLATVLYTDYVIAFELVSVLLLIAIIASIALSKRGTQAGALKQRVSHQVAADSKSRVRMVKMEAEDK
ncbi:MAG: NADH-quinone oxidoreductase subunit J [Legionellales bacterium]|jgi:NADH-quinone oxidoreductase subunit J|nr:NADH-quinone oxidoreductase subunit J [Legionellales bacterium]